MSYIDPDGMFGGDRMAMLSDSAKMAWPWFWCAGNTLGRVELNYREFTKTVFRQFKKPPAEQQFWDWVSEFHESYLMFVYQVSGKVWGQWFVSEKYLPTYKTVNDKRTPAAPADMFVAWQKKYNDLKISLISDKCRVLNISKTFENFSEGQEISEKFHMGVERRGEIEERKDSNTNAPDGALFDVLPDRKVKGKRTTEEVRKSLSSRLPWWEKFWAAYPCHDGMNPAMDAFDRLVTTEEIFRAVMGGAERYAAKARADPSKKLKYGQGWLNDQRWMDEDAKAPVQQSKGPTLPPGARSLTPAESAELIRLQDLEDEKADAESRAYWEPYEKEKGYGVWNRRNGS
jgi:hypothetical protein